MEARVLGKETVKLIDGSEVEITMKAIGFVQKMDIVKKYTKDMYVKGYSYKNVDEGAIMKEILSISMQGAELSELDFDGEKLYKKYFQKDDEESIKKDDTSTT